MRPWVRRRADGEAPAEVVSGLRGVPAAPLVAELWWRRGVDDPAMMRGLVGPTLASLRHPAGVAGLDTLGTAVSGAPVVVRHAGDAPTLLGAAVLVAGLPALGVPVVEHGDGCVVRVEADAITVEAREGGRRVPAVLEGGGLPPLRLAPAAMAFYLLAALRTGAPGRRMDLRLLLDLVAVGILVGDAALVAEHRVLARHGMGALVERPRPALRALVALGCPGAVTAREIARRLGPRLDAAARAGGAGTLAWLAASDTDPDRQAVGVEVAAAEAGVVVARALDAAGGDDVVVLDAGGTGEAAQVARVLAERRGTAVAVRPPEPTDVWELGLPPGAAVPPSWEGDALVRRGDGVRVRAPEDVVRRMVHDAAPAAVVWDAEHPLAEATRGFVRAVAALEPTGPGQPEAVFVSRDVRIDGVRLIGDLRHPLWRLRLRSDGRTRSGVLTGPADPALLVPGAHVDVAWSARPGGGDGGDAIEIAILDVQPATPAGDSQPTDKPEENVVP